LGAYNLEKSFVKKRNKGWGSKIKDTSHIGLLGIDKIKVIVRLTTKAIRCFYKVGLKCHVLKFDMSLFKINAKCGRDRFFFL
jgi:hypothetical protein